MPVQVLVVEDSPTQALRLELILEKEGFAVLVARTAEKGIAMALRHLPGVVVLDVNLPDLDGFKVCQILKTHPATMAIPVVMLTVKDRAADTIAGLGAGADAYIPKDDFAEINLLQTLRDLSILPAAAGYLGENREGGDNGPEGAGV